MDGAGKIKSGLGDGSDFGGTEDAVMMNLVIAPAQREWRSEL
jgi:hypothetical protein